MSNEESKSDVVREARELLRKITPDWRLQHSPDTDICKILVGNDRWKDFNHHLPENAALIARAPRLISALCDEVERLRKENEQLRKCDACERTAIDRNCRAHRY